MTTAADLPALIDDLTGLYAESAARLRSALARYLRQGERPTPDARAAGAFAYPELRLHYEPEGPAPRVSRAFARLNAPGAYAVTVTRPELFRAYLIEQLELIVGDYPVTISVGLSQHEIPYPYVLDGADDLQLDGAQTTEIARYFPSAQLELIGDEVADGVWAPALEAARPLGLFDAGRVDFSLARLRHYTGTPAADVQPYILFTNYNRYVDEFVRWGAAELAREGSPYARLSAAGGVEITAKTPDGPARVAAGDWRKHQMPAYHLIGRDGFPGVTLVNIGVGPSNAKTICDHLAVLRPHAWLMIGHCGGLRPSQTIGDYVLAHAYLRDDHVLDAVLPVEIPIPPIAEVQRALFRRRRNRLGRVGRGFEAALAHRHRGDHRRSELGAALRLLRHPLQPEPGGGDRYGVRHHRRAGLSPAGALRHAALRVGQAAARRDQAAGPGQPLLRAGHQPAPEDRAGGGGDPPARGVEAPLAQAEGLRRAAVPVRRRAEIVSPSPAPGL